MTDETILEIKNMSKSFGKNVVLKNVNIQLKKGHVLGLMGENGAGKSTMMNCLFGIYQKNSGEIYFKGNPTEFNGPRDALFHGIAMVHQELNQCLDRTVLDNLYLGKYETKLGLVIDEAKEKAEALRLFAQLGINIDPSLIMRHMAVAQRQMVEIAKAVSYNAEVIILDEPTSSLAENEVKKLFDIIRKLTAKGVSFVYISHKMDEVFEICDDVAVLRDGEVIFQKPVPETNMGEIVAAMVGRSLENRFPPLTNHPGEEILTIQHLFSKYEPVLKDISFSVRKGEILGIYGLIGAGCTELLECLFGLRTIASAEIRYRGKLLNFRNSHDAMKENFAMITEERKANGMFKNGDLIFNTCITNLNDYMDFGFVLNNSKMRKATENECAKMHVKCMGPDDMITSLSGGNQQKVIIGKWLERSPDVFLMDEPTRGIDILAKYEVYELIIRMAEQGKTILMVSSEMPELLGITNRIAVLSNKQLAGIVDTKATNQEELLRLSAKYL